MSELSFEREEVLGVVLVVDKVAGDKVCALYRISAVMYLPISLVGYEKAVSKGSTLTCVIIVDTGL